MKKEKQYSIIKEFRNQYTTRPAASTEGTKPDK
jgi:hypothetical protein